MPAAALVLGAAERRHLDDEYRGFFRQIARQLSAALSSAAGLAAVQARADELAELDRAKTEFFSNVSHEFRTPLTLMLGPLSDALSDPGADPAAQRDRIEIAQRGALRLLRLVNALLDLSRIEAGRAAPAFAPVDVGRLARDSAASFQPATERAGLELVVDVPAEGTTIEADPDMLENILLNLLSNACKFTFDGSIELRVRVGERVRARGRRHRRRDRRGRAAAAVRALPPRPRRARPQPRGQRHRARARARAGRAARRHRVGRERRRRGQHVPGRAARPPARATQAATGADPAQAAVRRDGFGQEALQWLEGERIVPAAPGRRPSQRCSSSTTTPTCGCT